MKKEDVIEIHARKLKSEVGTGLSTSECYQIIKSAVNEVLNLPVVIKRKWWNRFYIGYAVTLTIVNLIAGILAFMFL